ncbi:MAG: N-formylglutamate amidohydrolase [Proteobacteria bacterium]|nr:N-formylglutamate amidohydrolase [Burkholderiales bacterium]
MPTTMPSAASPSIAPAVRLGVWIRWDATDAPAPLVVDVSRSGREYPHEFRSPLPFTVVHDNASMYVEELFGHTPAAGGTLLYACFPNTYVDVNRDELDLDPAVIDGEYPVPLAPTPIALRGLGLIKTLSRYGEPMQEKPLTPAEVEERLERFHRPYHEELLRIVAATHRRDGYVLQLSCHCMSAVGAPTHGDAGRARADFCISDLNGITASPRSMEFVVETLRSFGWSVSINDPYLGNELIRRHGAPARGIDSIQIEVNKKNFMDVKTFRRNDGFERVRADLSRLLDLAAGEARRRAAG